MIESSSLALLNVQLVSLSLGSVCTSSVANGLMRRSGLRYPGTEAEEECQGYVYSARMGVPMLQNLICVSAAVSVLGLELQCSSIIRCSICYDQCLQSAVTAGHANTLDSATC